MRRAPPSTGQGGASRDPESPGLQPAVRGVSGVEGAGRTGGATGPASRTRGAGGAAASSPPAGTPPGPPSQGRREGHRCRAEVRRWPATTSLHRVVR